MELAWGVPTLEELVAIVRADGVSPEKRAADKALQDWCERLFEEGQAGLDAFAAEHPSADR